MSKDSQKPWAPLSPEEIASVFAAATFPWWIAGGYSIEHFVGRPLRPHDDIDLLVLAKDHAAATRHRDGVRAGESLGETTRLLTTRSRLRSNRQHCSIFSLAGASLLRRIPKNVNPSQGCRVDRCWGLGLADIGSL